MIGKKAIETKAVQTRLLRSDGQSLNIMGASFFNTTLSGGRAGIILCDSQFDILVRKNEDEIIGRSYKTIGSALDFVSTRPTSSFTINVESGVYREKIVIDCNRTCQSRVSIIGDQRKISGISYVHHATFSLGNCAALPYLGGPGTVTLSNPTNAQIQITVSGGDPDLISAGVKVGDMVSVCDNSGTNLPPLSVFAVNANTVTISGYSSALNPTTSLASSITFLPDVVVWPDSDGICVAACSCCSLTGFLLRAFSTLTGNYGLLVPSSSCVTVGSLVSILCDRGFFASGSLISSTENPYCTALSCSSDGFSCLCGCVDIPYAFAISCATGFGAESGSARFLSCCSSRSSNYGFFSRSSYMDADSSFCIGDGVGGICYESLESSSIKSTNCLVDATGPGGAPIGVAWECDSNSYIDTGGSSIVSANTGVRCIGGGIVRASPAISPGVISPVICPSEFNPGSLYNGSWIIGTIDATRIAAGMTWNTTVIGWMMKIEMKSVNWQLNGGAPIPAGKKAYGTLLYTFPFCVSWTGASAMHLTITSDLATGDTIEVGVGCKQPPGGAIANLSGTAECFIVGVNPPPLVAGTVEIFQAASGAPPFHVVHDGSTHSGSATEIYLNVASNWTGGNLVTIDGEIIVSWMFVYDY